MMESEQEGGRARICVWIKAKMQYFSSELFKFKEPEHKDKAQVYIKSKLVSQ